MKAVRIKGPSEVKIENVPIKKPGDNEALIKVKAAGICGTDYDLYTNDMIYISDGRTKLPITPGHEWAGIIEKVGEEVTNFKVGERVTGECTVSCGQCEYCVEGNYNMCVNRTETGIMNREGGFAEYIIFPVSHLHKFSQVSFKEAALTEPTGIAMYSLIKGDIKPYHNVMVTGPGPIGLMTAQIAKKVFNAKNVILIGTREGRLKRADTFGLDGTVNIREEDVAEKVEEFTEGEMIDIVIETSGGKSVFKDIEAVIQPSGRVVLVGFFGSKQPDIKWDSFIVRDIDFISSLGSPAVWDNVIELMESGRITVEPLISHIMNLEEFEKGLETMVKRKENVCKVILKP